MLEFPIAEAKDLIQKAIKEDIAGGDITTELTFTQGENLKAKVISKDSGILAGLPFVNLVFEQFDDEVEEVMDGRHLKGVPELLFLRDVS